MHPLIESIKTIAIEPVINLIESSKHILNHNLLTNNRDFAPFRKMALVQTFVDDLSGVCNILKEHPNPKGRSLDLEYDIRHILDLLLLEGWEKEPALKFFFDKL